MKFAVDKNNYLRNMRGIQTMETSALIDLLVTETADYTKMINEGTTQEEFARCSLTIKAIQTEIEFRKEQALNTSADNHEIIVTGLAK